MEIWYRSFVPRQCPGNRIGDGFSDEADIWNWKTFPNRPILKDLLDSFNHAVSGKRTAPSPTNNPHYFDENQETNPHIQSPTKLGKSVTPPPQRYWSELSTYCLGRSENHQSYGRSRNTFTLPRLEVVSNKTGLGSLSHWLSPPPTRRSVMGLFNNVQEQCKPVFMWDSGDKTHGLFQPDYSSIIPLFETQIAAKFVCIDLCRSMHPSPKMSFSMHQVSFVILAFFDRLFFRLCTRWSLYMLSNTWNIWQYDE